MIGDGECQPACYSSVCSYDGSDCGCAPNCTFDMYGQCSFECLVPNCGYDGCFNAIDFRFAAAWQAMIKNAEHVFNFEKDCTAIAPKCIYEYMVIAIENYICYTDCEPCAHAFGSCFTGTPSAGCSWAYGPNPGECLRCDGVSFQMFTSCVEHCPRSMPPHPITTMLCYPRKDVSSETSPDCIYVTSNKAGGDLGTEADPYHAISSAFAQSFMAYTVVYLLDGVHELAPLDQTLPEGMLAKDPNDPLVSGFSVTSLLITTLFCTGNGSDHALCATSRATIHIKDVRVFLTIAVKVTFEKVVIDGTKSLLAGCTAPECYYCPNIVTNEDGSMVTDKGDSLNPSTLVHQSVCDANKDSSLFVVQTDGILTMKDVKIENIRYQPKAVIQIKGGIVDLENVDFSNIIVNIGQGAVIGQATCATSYDCGSLTYISGTVSYLNNGYEYVPSLGVSGFLAADGLRDIAITSVTFEKNIVVTQSEPGGMILLKRFRSLKFENCVFRNNIVTKLVQIISQNLAFSKLVDSSNNVIDYALDHIAFIKTQFTSNVFEASLLSTAHFKDLQNIKIDSCVFTDNFNLGGLTIIVVYAGKMTTDIVSGQTKMVTLPDSSKVQGYFAKRWVTVSGSRFERNYGKSLFSLSNVANVNVLSSTFVSNGATNLSYNDIVISAFINDPNAYLKHRHIEEVPPIRPCDQLLNFAIVSGVGLDTVTFSNNNCDMGPAGLEATKISTAFTLTSVAFTDNQSQSSTGAVMTLQEITIPLSFSGLVFQRNSNANSSSKGLVYFDSGLSVILTACNFDGNRIAVGGAIYTNDAMLLKVSDSTFDSNSAIEGSGGALYIVVSSGLSQYNLEVTSCAFKSNQSIKAKGGGIFVTSDKNTRPLGIRISKCSFTSNKANLNGAAVYIDSLISVASGSRISSCTLIKNDSGRGTISVYYLSGTLTISDGTFTGNTAKGGAGITSSTQIEAILIISNSKFTSNNSSAGVVELTYADIKKTLITTNCAFQSNIGVSVVLQSGVWTDTGSSFTSNTGSAVILSDSSTATLQGTVFTSNASSGDGGAASLTSQSSLKCSKCTFSKNSAVAKGGAVFLQQYSKIEMSDCSFIANQSTDKGSAIFLLSSLLPVSSISTSSFKENAAGSSGVISLLSSTLNLISVSFDGNTAKTTTPGIVLNLSTLTVKSSTFTNHKADLGSFLYSTTESSASFTDCLFSSASAQTGGAFNIIASTLILINSRLTSITADFGAGFVAYSRSAISLSNVVIESLRATDSAIGVVSEGTLQIVGSTFSSFSSGGIQGDRLTSADIRDSKFIDGSGNMGSAFGCTKCQFVNVVGCSFLRNNATYGGALYLTSQSDVSLKSAYKVEFTSFANNSAWRGGAVYTNNVDIWFDNCTFYNNSASKPTDKALQSTAEWGYGGGVVIDCKDVSKCVFNFTTCEFRGNTAEVSGGGISWSDVKPNISSSFFKDNKAEYARDISSFPVAIKQITSGRFLESVELSGVASGQTTTQSLVVGLIDHYGEIVTTDSTSTAEFVPKNAQTTSVSGITKVTAVKGLFTFNQFKITAAPGTKAEVEVFTSAIDTQKADKAKDFITYAPSIAVEAKMRLCVLGESHVGDTCQVCESGKYSLDPNSTACQSCPTEAICYGNYTMVPRSGYWRPRLTIAVFYKCLYPSACTGSPEPPADLSMTGNCATGYRGNLCESCQKDFSRTNKYECAPCPNQSINIVRIVFILIAVAILAGVMVYTTMRSAQREKSLSSIYIKIFMNYLQIIILTASFNLSWPDQVVELFSTQETAGSFTEQAFSIDCFLQPEGTEKTDAVVYNKLIVMAVTPVILATVSLLAWIGIYFNRRYLSFPVDGLVSTIVILLFLAHPTLTKYFFNMYTCMEIDGKQYLLQQLDVECWSFDHVFYSVVCSLPAILLWVLGIPAVCLTYLMRNKRNLGTMTIRIRLGFLFNGYRLKAYYWEFVILYRKILIICCSVFLTTVSIPVQALCVMFVLVASTYLQDLVKPFTTKDLNEMELKSIICATVTIYCGLFFLTGDLGNVARFVLFIAIVIVNAYFLWHWSRKLFGFYIQLAITKVPCLRRRLGNIRKVGDGLEEDLFVRPKHYHLFPISLKSQVSITPVLHEVMPLRFMRDMYLMKLHHVAKQCSEHDSYTPTMEELEHKQLPPSIEESNDGEHTQLIEENLEVIK